MFSVTHILALAAAVSSASAGCIRKSGSGSQPSQAPSVASYAVSSAAAPTPTGVSSSLIPTSSSSSQPAYSNSAAQAVYTPSSTPSTAVAAAETSTSAAATSSSPAAASSSTAKSSSSDGTKYMVVFGDSYSSTGFYIEGGYPSASEPIGEPSLPGQTTSGGLNWVGMVTSEFNTSTVLTYDWAYYGADVSNAIINTGVTTDVIAQVAKFKTNLVPAPSEAPWTADNLLVAVWIGVNDIGECFWESAEYPTCPIDEVMTEYFSLLQELYDDGVRNFVLNTVPPFYKAPAFVDQSDSSIATLVSNLDSYNSKLVSNLAEFETNNTGITAQVFNTTSYFWDVLDDPTAYGLGSDITAANSDGTSAVWYDNYHPGQAIHKLVAKGFVEALTGTFF